MPLQIVARKNDPEAPDDGYVLPREIGELIHQKFLCIKGYGRVMTLLSSIDRLVNLQSLDLGWTAAIETSKLLEWQDFKPIQNKQEHEWLFGCGVTHQPSNISFKVGKLVRGRWLRNIDSVLEEEVF